jgi:hypothetical protein
MVVKMTKFSKIVCALALVTLSSGIMLINKLEHRPTTEAVSADVPTQDDVGAVVYQDANETVLVFPKYIVSEGDVKTTLVAFVFSQQAMAQSGAVGESGRISVNCENNTFKLLSDNVLGEGGKVVKSIPVKGDWSPIKHNTVASSIQEALCVRNKELTRI